MAVAGAEADGFGDAIPGDAIGWFKIGGGAGDFEDGTGVDSWPFNAPQYLILNLAMAIWIAIQNSLTSSLWTLPDEVFLYMARGPTNNTDQLGKLNRYTFDQAGRKTAETSSNNETVSYTHNDAGNVLTLTDHRGKTTIWTYNAEGRMRTKRYHGQTLANLEYYAATGNYSNSTGWTVSQMSSCWKRDLSRCLRSMKNRRCSGESCASTKMRLS